MRTLIQTLKSKSNPVEYFFKQDAEVKALFKASGYAFVHPKGVELAGLTPPIDYIKELITKLKPQFGSKGQLTAAVHNLTTLDAKWSELASMACGVIAAPVSSMGDSFFLLFRPELLQTVNWGGDPRKTMQRRDYQGIINPRKSFESWTETVRHQGEPWKDYEIEGANYLRDLVFDTFAQKEQLMRELSERLKSSSVNS
jgi:light-regulated signal transduction histidine kinase (bacteriophytochrome)